MNSRLTIVLALFASLTAKAQTSRIPDRPRPIASVPIRFRSVNRRGTAVVDVRASAYVFDDSIKVVVRQGFLPLWSTPTERIDALAVGLAYGDTSATWRLRRDSPKVYLRDIKAQGDTLRDSVVFWISGTRGL